MYVNIKQRKNKKGELICYVYLCESRRIEGKVKNTQTYVGNINTSKFIDECISDLKVELEKKDVEQLKKKINNLLVGGQDNESSDN